MSWAIAGPIPIIGILLKYVGKESIPDIATARGFVSHAHWLIVAIRRKNMGEAPPEDEDKWPAA